MTDLELFRDHARTMAAATHRPECLTRPNPWTKPRPAPGCEACVSDADRELWARLADEVDAYLRIDDDQPSLDQLENT